MAKDLPLGEPHGKHSVRTAIHAPIEAHLVLEEESAFSFWAITAKIIKLSPSFVGL